MPSIPGAYVRIAEPHELTEVAWILTRAFARDPCMNWLGGVKEMVPHYNDQPNYESHPPAAKRTLKRLFTFQQCLVKGAIFSGGFLTVAVIPQEDGKEVLAAVTMWFGPGQALDFPLSTMIRAGVPKVLLDWGFKGVKRLLLDVFPVVEKSLEKGFRAHNLSRLDSWHLLEVVVDPPYEGNGLCSLMMKDGFQRTFPKPIHLEATTSRNRDIYAHFGFEVDEEHCFGKGSVNINGLAAKGNDATGFPEWIMTKWTYDT